MDHSYIKDKREDQKLNITLFLGAGSSVQFDNPDTKRIKELMFKDNSYTSLKPILNMELFPDIEHVVKFLQEISDLKNNYVYKFLTNNQFPIVIGSEPKVTIKDMISDDQGFHSVMHFLFQNYIIKSEFKSELRKFFKNLFCLITKYSDRIDIGTTNYDLAVETFCNSAGSDYRLVDGFEFDTSYIWRPEVFQQIYVGEKCVYLYKIHGSLDWTGQNTNITKVDMPIYLESGGSSANTIIAPTLSPKDAYEKEPFSTLLKFYGEKLSDSDACIVIGFSFRDNDISNYFKTFVEKGKQLIIISPSCHRNYVMNLFKLKDDGTEAEMKDIANKHERGNGRKVTFIDNGCSKEKNQEIFDKINNVLSITQSSD